MFDATSLDATSTKKSVPWRDTRLALLRVATSGHILQAATIEEKSALVAAVDPGDCLLAIRIRQFPNRPEVLHVDDLAPVKAALQ